MLRCVIVSNPRTEKRISKQLPYRSPDNANNVEREAKNGSATPAVYEGWLDKQGRTFGMWSRRYFRLVPGILEYYSLRPTSADAELRGCIYVAGIKRVVALAGSLEIELLSRRRTYRLRTYDSDSREKWLGFLHAAKEACKDEPPPYLFQSKNSKGVHHTHTLRKSVLDGFAAIASMEEMTEQGLKVSSDVVSAPGLEATEDAPEGVSELRPGNECVLISWQDAIVPEVLSLARRTHTKLSYIQN